MNTVADSTSTNGQETKKLTIMLIKAPYVSEAADMALKTALRARRMGYEVSIFLYLDGAWNSHIVEEKQYNNPGEWIRSVIQRGISVTCCERCADARDLTKDNMIDGVRITGSYPFMDLLMDSDKVLSFGG